MRSFFPFAVLALAAVIPACTCSSKTETTEAPAAPPPASTTISSVIRPAHMKMPTRINATNVRNIRLPGVATGAAGAGAGGSPDTAKP